MTQTRLIVGGFILLGLSLVGLWSVSQPTPPEAPPLAFVDNPNALVDFVELPRLGILTSTNYVGHRIRVIEGTIRNVGDRTLRSVELNLAFMGFDGEVVMEFQEQGLTRPLLVGGEHVYSFRYENLPAEWNYRVPDVQILRIGY